MMPQFFVKRCQPSAHQYAYVKSVKHLKDLLFVKLSRSQLKGFFFLLAYKQINKELLSID